MLSELAYAETGDFGSTNLMLIVASVAVLATTVIMALLLIALAGRRGGRRAEVIRNLAIVWSVLTVASVLYAGAARMRWSKEYTTDIASGYFDPRDTSGKPQIPWILWTSLGAAYIAMLTWALSEKRER